MMKSILFVVLLCTVCVYAGEIRQYGGTLFLDSIQANLDPVDGTSIVQIEGTMWDDTSLMLDFIEGQDSEFGVEIEDSLMLDGSMYVPDDIVVGDTGTFSGLLSANGGIICDDGDQDDDTNTFSYSWKLDDDTGCLSIVGQLFPNGGFRMDDVFMVEDNTGRTYIKGLTRPDGGLNANNQFEVSDLDGDIQVDGNLSVEEDIFFGTFRAEERTVGRSTSSSAPVTAGPTTIIGQDAGMTGGHIVLEPGFATGLESSGTHGQLIIGAPGNYALDIERFQVDDEDGITDGGDTIYSGQDAAANGGKLIVKAGNSETNNGGDINLATGVNAVSPDNFGRIVLGGSSFEGDYNQRDNFDYFAQRPTLADAQDGASTFFVGQNVQTTSDSAGDVRLIAGSVNAGVGTAGKLVLGGGDNAFSQDTGLIYLGNDLVNDIFIRRPALDANGNAGDLYFRGQDSASGNGGDLFFRSGSGGASGDLFLETGLLANTGNPGIIETGNMNTALVYSMPGPMVGSSTTITGQEATSTGTTGGALNLNAGVGTDGGSVHLKSGEANIGGSILLAAGNGALGAVTTISAGSGTAAGATGGHIFIRPGSSGFMAAGVDVSFNPGASIGGNPGDVQISNTANQLTFKNIPVVVDSNTFTIDDTTSGNNLIFDTSSIATGVFNINGDSLLTTRQTYVLQNSPNPYAAANLVAAATALRQGVSDIITACETHGLVETL